MTEGIKIKQIKIKDYIGIEELIWNPGNTNVIAGPKGSGKSSILEGIEKNLSNNGRRTEIIRHGAEEALLFVGMDNGLEIDRRLRNDKSDYLKLTGNMVSKSTEGELRKFLSGDIFRPLDFIDLDVSKQTEIILGMIKMDYSDEEICNWFGEDVLSNINTSKHLLQILKDIESKYYNERREIKREIKTLEAQVKGIEQELPPNYDGGKWKNKNVQDYYDKVSKARDLKDQLEKAQTLKNNFKNIIAKIEAEAENDKTRIIEKYRQEKDDINDLVQVNEDKIKDLENGFKNIDDQEQEDIKRIDINLEKRIQELKEEARQRKESIKSSCRAMREVAKDNIQKHKEKIASKQSELNSLDEKKEIELESVNKETKQKIKAEKDKLGQASQLLEERKDIDKVIENIKELQEQADNVAKMREHLHEWNRMVDIRDGRLAKKEDYSDHLTNLIEIARNKPAELLHQHELPLEGISVDEEGRIRINGTLLDGLSDGEKFETAFKLSEQRMGLLSGMCLDGIEKLNEEEQVKAIRYCEERDIQVFVTRTEDRPDGKFEIIDERKQAEICKNCLFEYPEGNKKHCFEYDEILVGCKKFKKKIKEENNNDER